METEKAEIVLTIRTGLVDTFAHPDGNRVRRNRGLRPVMVLAEIDRELIDFSHPTEGYIPMATNSIRIYSLATIVALLTHISADLAHATIFQANSATVQLSSGGAFGTSADFGSSVTAMINGAGLSAIPDELNFQTVSHNSVTADSWLKNNVSPGPSAMRFFFNSPVEVDGILIWNYDFNNRDLDAFDIYISTDGINFNDPAGSGTLTVGGNPNLAQLVPLSARFSNVRAIELSNMLWDNTFRENGLREVQFRNSPMTIPEPAALILAAMGILSLAFGYRCVRRRK